MRRLLAFIALLVAAPAAAAFDDQPMDELTVGSSQRSVAATAGSGCVVGPASGGCADSAYPLPLKGTLLVRRGHQIAFELDHPAEAVRVALRDPLPSPSAGAAGEPYFPPITVVPDGPVPTARWVGTVPEELGDGFHRIGAMATYPSTATPSGDRDFEFAIHVIRRGAGRVKVPKLVGRSYAFAARELERRGLRWRIGRTGAVRFDTGPPGVVTPSRERVIAQWMRPNRRVARGTVVTLELRRAAG